MTTGPDESAAPATGPNRAPVLGLLLLLAAAIVLYSLWSRGFDRPVIVALDLLLLSLGIGAWFPGARRAAAEALVGFGVVALVLPLVVNLPAATDVETVCVAPLLAVAGAAQLELSPHRARRVSRVWTATRLVFGLIGR
jgi:hypothetical protein